MVGCSILGCKSRSERKIEGITFHTFPSNLKEKWQDATGRENWVPTKYSKICSIHFDEDSFVIKNKRVQLKPHSIPTKYIHSMASINQWPQQENTPLPSTSQEGKDKFYIPLSPPNKQRKVAILQEVQNIQPHKSTVVSIPAQQQRVRARRVPYR